jgi:hypothetical protein
MMENISALQKDVYLGNFFTGTASAAIQPSFLKPRLNPVYESLLSEGGETFFQYIDSLGISQESDMLILSSKHHYYYDHNDLTGVKVLINLKKLNFIKHLDSFFHVVFRMMPPKSKFIGCFTSSKTPKGKGFPFYQSANFFSRFLNFIDSRTDRPLHKDDVSRMLESHGFKVLDMTEINGEIFFSAQNKKMSVAKP